MNRHHIHCAPGLYGQEGVTSGEEIVQVLCDLVTLSMNVA